MIHKDLYGTFTMYVQQTSHFYLTACFGGIFSWWMCCSESSFLLPDPRLGHRFLCSLWFLSRNRREQGCKAQCQFYQWQPFPNSPMGSLWNKEDTFLYSSFHFHKRAECSSWTLPWPIRAEAVKGKGFALVCLQRSAGTQSLGPWLERGQD